MSVEFFVNNTNVVEVRDLTNNATGELVTGGTAECTIRRLGDSPVSGQIWPAAMTEVQAGLYRATLEYDIDLKPGHPSYLEVTVIGAGGETGRWRINFVAQTRDGPRDGN